jgi:hypothetical protein
MRARSTSVLPLLAVVAGLLATLLGGPRLLIPDPARAGIVAVRSQQHAAGTPIVSPTEPGDPLDGQLQEADPLDGDPLDGDPLDGPPRSDDPGAPGKHPRLDVARGGRPDSEPRTSAAYDQDPRTVWVPEAGNEETWLWVDLGETRRVRAVSWLAEGSGEIDVELSDDRRRWRFVETVDVERGWQGVKLRDDARYVRLTLIADDDGELPAIAEVAVYGPEDGASVSVEQDADEDRSRERRRQRANRNQNAAEEAPEDEADAGRERRGERGSGRIRVSAERGETRCTGDRGRCEAREGRMSVEEDCAAEGSCTIDIRADGGTAICDASGGRENEAGDGEGRRAGDGGECEAVADGGAVAIGDINP